MPMSNLIEYSNDYSHASGSLWQFKKNEVPADDSNLNGNKFQSFKYKTALVGKTADYVNLSSVLKNKRSCSINLFKEFLEITRNSINQ